MRRFGFASIISVRSQNGSPRHFLRCRVGGDGLQIHKEFLRVPYIAVRTKHRGLRREILFVNTVGCLYLGRLARQDERQEDQERNDDDQVADLLRIAGSVAGRMFLGEELKTAAFSLR